MEIRHTSHRECRYCQTGKNDWVISTISPLSISIKMKTIETYTNKEEIKNKDNSDMMCFKWRNETEITYLLKTIAVYYLFSTSRTAKSICIHLSDSLPL